MQDGVIIATPARVVALVRIVRQHVVQGHTMRMSNTERADKTAALYDFITSERCTQLFERIDSQAQQMLDLQEKEMRMHKIDTGNTKASCTALCRRYVPSFGRK